MNTKQLIRIAVLAAKEAGGIHKKYFDTKLRIRSKSKPFNLITVADIEAEKRIVSIIRSHFPEHNFLAEEDKYKNTLSEYTWIIDPLDGTNNFAYGLPIFCVSIALAWQNEVILGVVYDVMRDELFSAIKGRGAFLNGKKISVSKINTLKDSLLITGFYYNRGEDMIENLERIKRLFLRHIVGIRRFGSAALDLCYIACGRASGFWEFELNPWDFAAGELLIGEAGGKVTKRFGEEVTLEKSFIVASNGRIHRQLLKALR